MKIKFNEKYNTIALYSLIIMVAGILVFQLVSKFPAFKSSFNGIFRIFKPLIVGFVMAYVFNFILEFYEKLIVKHTNKDFIKENHRVVGMIFTYLTVAILVYLFVALIFPQLINSITGIVNNIPEYVELTTEKLLELDELITVDDEISKYVNDQIQSYMENIVGFMSDLVPLLWRNFRKLIIDLWNIIIGLIISIYLLKDKEKFIAIVKKLIIGIFPEKISDSMINITNRADAIFSGFLWGKIIDSAIVAVLLFVILSIFKIPYKLLLSFIVGVTNVIPFFGPFIGAIPGVIILLFEDPIKAVTYTFLILVVQQIDGNIIGPRILGSSIGISPFWILISLLIMGDLLGLIGLIIGVPLFALIYSIIKDIIDKRLKEKGLATELYNYIPDKKI